MEILSALLAAPPAELALHCTEIMAAAQVVPVVDAIAFYAQLLPLSSSNLDFCTRVLGAAAEVEEAYTTLRGDIDAHLSALEALAVRAPASVEVDAHCRESLAQLAMCEQATLVCHKFCDAAARLLEEPALGESTAHAALALMLDMWSAGVLDARSTLYRVQALDLAAAFASLASDESDAALPPVPELLAQIDVQLGSLYHSSFTGLSVVAQAIDNVWTAATATTVAAPLPPWIFDAAVRVLAVHRQLGTSAQVAGVQRAPALPVAADLKLLNSVWRFCMAFLGKASALLPSTEVAAAVESCIVQLQASVTALALDVHTPTAPNRERLFKLIKFFISNLAKFSSLCDADVAAAALELILNVHVRLQRFRFAWRFPALVGAASLHTDLDTQAVSLLPQLVVVLAARAPASMQQVFNFYDQYAGVEQVAGNGDGNCNAADATDVADANLALFFSLVSLLPALVATDSPSTSMHAAFWAEHGAPLVFHCFAQRVVPHAHLALPLLPVDARAPIAQLGFLLRACIVELGTHSAQDLASLEALLMHHTLAADDAACALASHAWAGVLGAASDAQADTYGDAFIELVHVLLMAPRGGKVSNGGAPCLGAKAAIGLLRLLGVRRGEAFVERVLSRYGASHRVASLVALCAFASGDSRTAFAAPPLVVTFSAPLRRRVCDFVVAALRNAAAPTGGCCCCSCGGGGGGGSSGDDDAHSTASPLVVRSLAHLCTACALLVPIEWHAATSAAGAAGAAAAPTLPPSSSAIASTTNSSSWLHHVACLLSRTRTALAFRVCAATLLQFTCGADASIIPSPAAAASSASSSFPLAPDTALVILAAAHARLVTSSPPSASTPTSATATATATATAIASTKASTSVPPAVRAAAASLLGAFGRMPVSPPFAAAHAMLRAAFRAAFAAACALCTPLSSSSSSSPPLLDAVCAAFVECARHYAQPTELIPAALQSTVLPRIRTLGSGSGGANGTAAPTLDDFINRFTSGAPSQRVVDNDDVGNETRARSAAARLASSAFALLLLPEATTEHRDLLNAVLL